MSLNLEKPVKSLSINGKDLKLLSEIIYVDKGLFNQLVNGTLTEVTEEDLQGDTKVNAYAFYNQGKLTKVALPSTITSIGEYAFYDCTYLQSINLGENIKSVGKYAFYNCQSLRQPIFLSSDTSIGESAFAMCNMTKFKGYGYKTTKTTGYWTFQNCSNLKIIEFNEGLLSFEQMNGNGRIGVDKFIVPSTCISIYTNEIYQAEVIIKATVPPKFSSANTNFAKNKIIYVPLASIEQYKVTTNATIYTFRPLVKTYEDLSTIDTTLYTKACVEGNEKGIEDENNYKIYNYTNGEWVAE